MNPISILWYQRNLYVISYVNILCSQNKHWNNCNLEYCFFIYKYNPIKNSTQDIEDNGRLPLVLKSMVYTIQELKIFQIKLIVSFHFRIKKKSKTIVFLCFRSAFSPDNYSVLKSIFGITEWNC